MASPPSSQSQHDVDLAKRASRLAGKTISPGQIRRWRKAKLLPMTKRGLGRGRGWSYEFPEGSAEFAAAIAEHLLSYRRLEDAARAAFVNGTSPASVDVLVRLFAPPDAEAMLGSDPHREATRLANVASRRASRSELLTEVKATLGRPSDLNTMLRGSFGFMFTGEQAGLGEALDVLGVSGPTSDELGRAIEADIGDVSALPEHMGLLRAVLADASLEDFEQARSDAISMSAGMRQVTALASMLGLPAEDDPGSMQVDAVEFVPIALVMRRGLGDEEMQAILGAFEDPTGYVAMVAGAFQEWASERPEDAALLRPVAVAALRSSLS